MGRQYAVSEENEAIRELRADQLRRIAEWRDAQGRSYGDLVRSGTLSAQQKRNLLEQVLFANMFDVRATSSNQAVAGFLALWEAERTELMEKAPKAIESAKENLRSIVGAYERPA